jgi:hypothetical protein
MRSNAASGADRDLNCTVPIREGPVSHLVGNDQPVWHDDFGTVCCANNARPNTDAADFADIGISLHDVTDLNRSFKEQNQSANKIIMTVYNPIPTPTVKAPARIVGRWRPNRR